MSEVLHLLARLIELERASFHYDLVGAYIKLRNWSQKRAFKHFAIGSDLRERGKQIKEQSNE